MYVCTCRICELQSSYIAVYCIMLCMWCCIEGGRWVRATFSHLRVLRSDVSPILQHSEERYEQVHVYVCTLKYANTYTHSIHIYLVSQLSFVVVRDLTYLRTQCHSCPSWAELSRPQVHGYDLSSIVSGQGDPYTIYTAGGEKIIRCFEVIALTTYSQTSVLTGSEVFCTLSLPYDHFMYQSLEPPTNSYCRLQKQCFRV